MHKTPFINLCLAAWIAISNISDATITTRHGFAQSAQNLANKEALKEVQIRTWIEEANLLQAAGKHEDTISLWKRIISEIESISGPDHPDVATALTFMATAYSDLRNYDNAEALLQKSLGIQKRVFGKNSLQVADLSFRLGVLYEKQGLHEKSLPLYTESLTITQQIQGNNHPSTALIQESIAVAYDHLGLHARAESLYKHVLDFNVKNLGISHPATASIHLNLAVYFNEQKKYQEASALLERLLEARAIALGKLFEEDIAFLELLALSYRNQGLHKSTIETCKKLLLAHKQLGGDNNESLAFIHEQIGFAYLQLSYIDLAMDHYRQSLKAKEVLYHTEPRKLIDTIDMLTDLSFATGRYEDAEPLAKRSLVIIEKSDNTDYVEIADRLNYIGQIYFKRGLFDLAESAFNRSLSANAKLPSEDDYETAKSLNGLAMINFYRGYFNVAEQQYERSIEILKNTKEPNPLDMANAFGNLALLYSDQGLHDKAIAFAQRSLSIAETSLEQTHPYFVIANNNLALVTLKAGEEKPFTLSLSLFNRSLELSEKAHGADHPTVAEVLSNIGLIHLGNKTYKDAETALQRSLEIKKRTLGLEHISTSVSMNNLGLLYSEQGFNDRAESLYRESLKHSDGLMRALTLSNLAASYVVRGLNRQAIPMMAQSIAIEFNWLSRELPLLPDRSRISQLAIFGNTWKLPFSLLPNEEDAVSLALHVRLNRQGLLQEIEQRQTLVIGASGPERKKIDKLRKKTQRLSAVTTTPNERKGLSQEIDMLQTQLNRSMPDLSLELVETAAVARILPADGVLVEFQRFQPFDGRKTRDERWKDPNYVALLLKPTGDVAAVQLGPSSIIEQAIDKALSATALNQIDSAHLWHEVSRLLLMPIQPQLAGARQLFLSPDGELNRVPFAALPVSRLSSEPLAAAVQLRMLTTGRELLRLQKASTESSNPVVIANPSFDRPSALTYSTTTNSSRNVPQRRSGDLINKRWEPLHATALEGQQVAALLGTHPLMGHDPTPSRLQQKNAPRVLHIATHGFFLSDQESPITDSMRAFQEQSPLLQGLQGEPSQLRSGLALAGANQPDGDPNDDGYLTAAEVVSLNLNGTELVVLSACSTGQGDIRTGEGVYGLQRALTVAGARSTLLSLWKVDDAATAEFMVRFYKLLKDGESRADALAAVQNEFRTGSVKGPRGEDWSEPFFWAAWQLTGDWGPIPGL